MNTRGYATKNSLPFTMGVLREIMAQMKDVPDEMRIRMSADPEGNAFGELASVDVCKDSLLLWPRTMQIGN